MSVSGIVAAIKAYIAGLSTKTIIIGALVAASTVYTILSNRRQQKELEQRLFDNRPRFGIRDTPSGDNLKIVVGDTVVEGTPVDWEQSSDLTAAGNALKDVQFYREDRQTGAITPTDRPITSQERRHVRGKENTTFGALIRIGFAPEDTYLMVPYVFSASNLGDISEVWVNDKEITVPTTFHFDRREDSVRGHALIEFGEAGTPSAAATAYNSAWKDHKFTELAFGWFIGKQEPINPQNLSSNRPNIKVFTINAGRWLTITENGFGPAANQNDLPTVIAGIASEHRKGLELYHQDIDFESFYAAKQLSIVEVPGRISGLDEEVVEEEPYEGYDPDASTATVIIHERRYPNEDTIKYPINSAHRNNDRPLKRYEVNGVIELNQAFASIVNQLTQVAPGTFVFRRYNGKLGIKVPDEHTPLAEQSVMDITDDMLMAPIQVTQNAAHHNKVNLTFPAASQDYARETKVWPPPNSPAEKTFREIDGKELIETYDMSFVNNEHHAYTAAATSVLQSRKEDYLIEGKGVLFPLERGDIVHISAEGYDVYGVVVVKSFTPRGTIEIGVRRFVKSDFGWRLSPLDDVIALPERSRRVPPPIAPQLVVNNESRVAVVTFTIDETKILNVTGFNVEIFNNETSKWDGAGSEGPDVRSFRREVAITADSVKYQIQTIAGRRKSEWVETATVDIGATPTVEGKPGLPALFRWGYDMIRQPANAEGQYRYTATTNKWEEFKRAGFVVINSVTADGENIADYYQSIRVGDQHGLIPLDEERFIVWNIRQVPNYMYMIEGALPEGITFSSETMSFTGTSNEAGDFPLNLTIMDSEGNTLTRTIDTRSS